MSVGILEVCGMSQVTLAIVVLEGGFAVESRFEVDSTRQTEPLYPQQLNPGETRGPSTPRYVSLSESTCHLLMPIKAPCSELSEGLAPRDDK